MNKFYLICLLLISAYPQQSQSEHIKVVTEYLEPYQIKNADGSLGGYMTEVVHALFRLTGDVPQITVMPWARAYQTAKTEKNVLIYTISPTKERSRQFHWLGTITTNEVFMWGLKAQFPRPVDSLEQIKNHRVAVLRDSNIATYLSSQQFSKLYPLTFEDQPLKMLFKNRVDLIVGIEKTILKQAKVFDPDLSKLTRVTVIKGLNTDLSLAFNIHSNPELIKRYRLAFQQLETSGELTRIKQKWAQD